MLQGSVSISPIYLNDYAHKLFELLISKQMGSNMMSEFSTKSMTWFNSLRNMIVNQFGYDGESLMNSVSWEYAICEGIKVAGIELLPGISRGRPSYAHLLQIKFQPASKSITARIEGSTASALSIDCLSFTLPLHQVPERFNVFMKEFLSRDPDSGRSPENAMKFRRRQKLVKRLLESLEIKRAYDSLLVLYATLLSLRRPLPYAAVGQRRKEWADLKQGSQSVDTYATSIVCVGMYYKYKELQRIDEDELEWNEFRRKLGFPCE